MTQECLDETVLTIMNASREEPTRYYTHGTDYTIYELHLQLPAGLYGEQVVMQWRYHTGRNIHLLLCRMAAVSRLPLYIIDNFVAHAEVNLYIIDNFVAHAEVNTFFLGKKKKRRSMICCIFLSPERSKTLRVGRGTAPPDLNVQCIAAVAA